MIGYLDSNRVLGKMRWASVLVYTKTKVKCYNSSLFNGIGSFLFIKMAWKPFAEKNYEIMSEAKIMRYVYM
jgi:hypothetical protein